jgi:uncharacterized membrane protein YgaE (UPF0421/DUF939 family)
MATALGGARVAVTQTAVSAILTVIAGGNEAGWQRLLDAGIGGSVALLFTQVIFSPEPVALLRHAETTAMQRIARELERTAVALGGTDDDLGPRALDTLRSLRDPVGELVRLRDAGSRVAQRSALWRSQRDAIAREQDHANRLELIASASVMLARSALDMSSPARSELADCVQTLSLALRQLAEAPGDRDARQQVVESLLAASRARDVAGEPTAELAFEILNAMARDLLIFAGLTPAEAKDAMRAGVIETKVPQPPPAPRLPFGFDRRRRERRSPDEQ